MNKFLFSGILFFCFATANASTDPLHLAGTYTCYGYDSHDGAYKNDTLTLTLDEKDSDVSHNYASYHFSLTDPEGGRYTGEAAANGNHLAIYFQNTASDKKTDRGVGIATVTHDKNAEGKIQTTLHKFYYEPDFKGGGNGYETCVKN